MRGDAKDQKVLMAKRKAFAIKIKALKEANEPLIYFDEVRNFLLTTFVIV